MVSRFQLSRKVLLPLDKIITAKNWNKACWNKYFFARVFVSSFFHFDCCLLVSHIHAFIAVQMPHMLFTSLEDYKARGTQAAPYFTVSFYKEFAETKDLVLIRGDIVFTSKLSDSEAKWLLETAQSFYLNDVRYKLVERFNKETRDFEFKDVLQALDMPIL